MAKVCFYNGIRLWQNLKHWKPNPQRAGQGKKIGVSRKLGKLQPASPNVFYEIIVHTSVEPAAASSPLGRQEVFNLQMLQMSKTLVEASDTLGYLSWVQDAVTDIATVGSVTDPMSFPGSGQFTYTPGSGFLPAAGDYILARKVSTGDGWVSAVESVAMGNTGLQCSFPSTASGFDKLYLVRFYFSDVEFDSLDGWETATQAEDRHSFDVAYRFTAASQPTYKSGYIPTIT